MIESENTILLTICCYTVHEDVCKKVTPEQSLFKYFYYSHMLIFTKT